jgi:hypothetical protein
MRHEIVSLMLSVSLLGSAAYGQEEPDPKVLLRDLGSPDREVRLRAAEAAGTAVYGLQEGDMLARFRQLLFGILAEEKDPEARAVVASSLQSSLAMEGTTTADLLRAEPYLLDGDERVRQVMWMGFSQQASQASLNDEIDARLLALTGHQDKQIRLAALNWALSASQSRSAAVGSPATELERNTLELCKQWSEDPDPVQRNLANYGLLSMFDRAPEAGMAVLARHLDDPYGDTRSLVLDFITQNGMSQAQLGALAPALLQRFRSRPSGGDFPLQADAELGPAALPPQGEVFRLALALAVLGPLPEDVWSYLEEDASKSESPEMLMQLAQVQGEAGRPLMGKLLQGKESSEWLEWADAFVDTGLPSQELGAVIVELGKRPLTFPQDDFDKSYSTRALMLIVARSAPASPEAIAAAQRHLASDAPMVRIAAVYALSVLDPKGPAGQAAVKTLMESDWSKLYTGTELLTCAAYRLKHSGLKATDTLVVEGRTQNALLEWVLGQPSRSSELPAFVGMYESARQNGRADGGMGTDLVLLELGWLEDHPQSTARPGLERLAKHQDAQIRAAAEKALAALP